MRHNRLLRAVSLSILAAALLVPAAAARTTVEVERTMDINLDVLAFGVTATCGFTVELHTVGKEVVVSRYDDSGALVSSTRQIVYSGYLLNPENGRTVSSMVAGPERTVYAEDGTIVSTITGTTHRNAPGGGLVSGFIGRERVVLAPTGAVDADGAPIYDVVEESKSGPFLGNGGVCPYLS